MERAFRSFIRAARRSPNLFAFAGGLFLAAGTPMWFDSFFLAFHHAESAAQTGGRVSPLFIPLIGLYNPLVRSGFALGVFITIIGVGVSVMILALARRFSRWQLPPP
jgi:hypothetical protein